MQSLPEAFRSKFKFNAVFELDVSKLVLAGSSAGAGCAAYLSQHCRDKDIPIQGVVLNVPVLCDYRHLPSECNQPGNSYEQSMHSFLSSGEMRAVWELVIPSAMADSDSMASPLLGDVKGLSKHAIFVAGQDPLRDEGLAYAKKLETEGWMSVSLSIRACHIRLLKYDSSVPPRGSGLIFGEFSRNGLHESS